MIEIYIDKSASCMSTSPTINQLTIHNDFILSSALGIPQIIHFIHVESLATTSSTMYGMGPSGKHTTVANMTMNY